MDNFKAYDIRGVFPTELNEEFVYNFALAFSTTFKPKKVIIGFDSRTSSKPLLKSLIQGLAMARVEIINAGLITTPMLNFLAKTIGGVEYGLIITASHSPKEYNGIKVASKTDVLSYDNGLRDVESRMKKFPIINTLPTIEKKEYSSQYIDFLIKNISIYGNLRLLVDCSHGSSGKIARDLFHRFSNISVQFLNDAPDGTFPNHGPNPSSEDSKNWFSERISDGKYDLGIMLDADGDRVMFFDEMGEVISPSKIAAFLIENSFPENSVIIKEVTCSRIIDDIAKIKKGKVITSKVGRVNIPPRMKKENAIFGVENSAHFYFKDFNNIDSGLYTSLKVIESLSLKKKRLSKIISAYNVYFEKDLIIPVKEGIFEGLINKFPKPEKVLKIDGKTLVYKDGWINIRKSNTEPIFRVKIESKKKKFITSIKKLTQTFIN